MTTTEDAIQRAFDRFSAARWGYPEKQQDLVACIDALKQIAEEQQGEIRMLKMRVAELADEAPPTVAPEADDLHPVALKLAEVYRLAVERDDVETETLYGIRAAWCDLTGETRHQNNNSIMRYGLPKC